MELGADTPTTTPPSSMYKPRGSLHSCQFAELDTCAATKFVRSALRREVFFSVRERFGNRAFFPGRGKLSTTFAGSVCRIFFTCAANFFFLFSVPEDGSSSSNTGERSYLRDYTSRLEEGGGRQQSLLREVSGKMPKAI